MHNTGEILQLCRLCLVKEQVNVPIFEGQGDVKQIFQKISSCLPVKINRSDKLPKNICDGCSEKLDLFYDFWNTSVNSEKQLLEWLGQTPLSAGAGTTIAAKNSKSTDPVQQIKVDVKQEPSDHTDNNESFQADASAVADEDETSFKSESGPPPKRARRAATKRKPITVAPDTDDDDDDDYEPVEPLTKLEDESGNSDNDNEDDSFANAPSTSADDQPGPSGIGKDGVEAPIKFVSELKNLIPAWTPDELPPSTKLEKIFEIVANSRFKCSYCRSANKEWDRFCIHLLNHMRKDRVFDKYASMCFTCNEYFSKPLNLAWRQLCRHQAVKKCRFACLVCYSSFPNWNSIKYHIFSAHEETKIKIKCIFCKTPSFSTAEELKAHMSASHKNVFKTLVQEINDENREAESFKPADVRIKVEPVENDFTVDVKLEPEIELKESGSKKLVSPTKEVVQPVKRASQRKKVDKVVSPLIAQDGALENLKVYKVCSMRTYSRKKIKEEPNVENTND